MKKSIFSTFLIVLTVFTLTAAMCSSKSDGSSGGGGKTLNSVKALEEYLDSQPVNGPDKPIKISMTINDPMYKDVVTVIKDAGKYVSLNITGDLLTEIGYFKSCKTLVGITIPKSVTSIGGYGNEAFAGCENLTSVTIPDSVTSIGVRAFLGCDSLTSVTIPSSVTWIGYGAFQCDNLTSVTFQGTITKDNFDYRAFVGDLHDKYLAGGPGTYTTTAPIHVSNSKWTKK